MTYLVIKCQSNGEADFSQHIVIYLINTLMNQPNPISEKTIALSNSVLMSKTTKFIRTSTISPGINQPESQSVMPASHSLQKRPQQIKKGIISRKTAERNPEPSLQQEKQNNRHPQNPVKSNSKSKIGTVQQIAMTMSASIFMNSTTKFVKGLLLNNQAKTQRAVTEVIKQNQKQKISPPVRNNLKNPEQGIQKLKGQKNINQSAKKSEAQNMVVPTLTNKRYQPPKNNQNNSIPLKSANTQQNRTAKKEQAIQVQKKSADRKQIVKRQLSPSQKSKNQSDLSSKNDRSTSRSPEDNAYKMAGQQYLSSTTKFVKNVRLAAPVVSATKLEPIKGKSPSTTVQRLQTEHSFTPIKQTIATYSNTGQSMPVNNPRRNRLQIENINSKVVQENTDQNTRKIERKGSKPRDIKFVQNKQEEPVSIMNYDSSRIQNQRTPASSKSQVFQNKKQVEIASKKPTANVQKKQIAKNVISDNFKNISKPTNRYIANFSNKQSTIQEKNQPQLAATKKGPFARQVTNKQTNSSKQEVLEATSKNQLRITKNLEQSTQVIGKKNQTNASSDNLQSREQAKSPKIVQNSTTIAYNHRQSQLKNTQKNDQINPRISKVEEQIAVESRKNFPKKPNQQPPVISTTSVKSVKQSKQDSYQPKLNQSKSTQVFQNTWSRPSQTKKITTQSQIKVNAPEENMRGFQKQKELSDVKSNPSIYSNKNIKQINNETNISKTQKMMPKLQTGNKAPQNVTRVTSPPHNTDGVPNKVQKQKIQQKVQKQTTNEKQKQKQKQKQVIVVKLRRSDLIFHNALKIYVTHMKIVFDKLKKKSLSQVRHKKQALILTHASSVIVQKFKINHLAQAFLSLKKPLLTIPPLARSNETLKESAKFQAATLLVKTLIQKQKHCYKTLAQYSWIKKQSEVSSQSFTKKVDEKSKQINNKKQLINIFNILRNYNLNKIRIAFNKIFYNSFGTAQTKKNIEIVNNNTTKKTINNAKSPQKPTRNYAEEKKVLLDNKNEVQAQIEKYDYRLTDKKRSVEFEKDKLIKKMDEFTKKVRKLQTQVSQKRKKNQELQAILASIPSSTIQLQLQDQPKIEQLTHIYSDLLRNNAQKINLEQFRHKYKLEKQTNNALIEEWNALSLNIELKKQISFWEGYEVKEQKLRQSLKNQQQLQRQLLRGYIRERYLWQWVHSVASKI